MASILGVLSPPNSVREEVGSFDGWCGESYTAIGAPEYAATALIPPDFVDKPAFKTAEFHPHAYPLKKAEGLYMIRQTMRRNPT